MLDSSQGIYPLGSYSSDLFCVALATNVFAETHSSAYDCQKRTMANTYTALYYHIVFSTKNREARIRQDIEERVWEYLGGIARHNDIVPAKIGGIDDHIHLVVSIPPSNSISKTVQLVKGGSSLSFHETFRRSAFAWQDGYGAFTVSKSQLPDVIRYVEGQRELHGRQTFQEEYRALLDRYGIEYDEQYLWG
jgi:putative transposase